MNEPDAPTGVILLAYGAPRSPAEIGPFLAGITGGRALPPAVEDELRQRYLRVGGSSPLPAITEAQAAALQRRLDAEGGRFHVAIGTLFSRPTLGDAVAALAERQVARAVAIALVPQYSAATVGRYLGRLEQEVAAAGSPFALATVRSWATHPLLVEAFAEKVCKALADVPPEERRALQVVFTAHSVPLSAVPEGDPYEDELVATAAGVAARTGIARWRLAYQSTGRSGGAWFGPTLVATVAELAEAGCRQVLVVPIHFLADNVEIIYDLDIALREHAERLGVRMLRSESLNTSPLLVAALADLARNAAF